MLMRHNFLFLTANGGKIVESSRLQREIET